MIFALASFSAPSPTIVGIRPELVFLSLSLQAPTLQSSLVLSIWCPSCPLVADHDLRPPPRQALIYNPIEVRNFITCIYPAPITTPTCSGEEPQWKFWQSDTPLVRWALARLSILQSLEANTHSPSSPTIPLIPCSEPPTTFSSDLAQEFNELA